MGNIFVVKSRVNILAAMDWPFIMYGFEGGTVVEGKHSSATLRFCAHVPR